jgi:hypothetical protein
MEQGLGGEDVFLTWATANGFITMQDLVHKYQFVLLQVSLVAGKR